MFQYSFVNTTCKITFELIKKLLRFDRFLVKYKFNFTNSFIYVHSPLGEFVHKWTQIEKAILTKDFFFLYVKEKNGYIISISNKNENRNIKELITFVERNVIQVTKV
ncbi:YcxB family protein [Flavobacterium sp. MDT1-60]|uniref:YcxB family protein n=1 Tax=Flavobacterium sp. MDT1-60 TaxID=1979344 RepID=UPI00351B8226